MKPRITVITLCVDDLERSVRFYRDGLGLVTEGIIGTEYEHGAVAFFDLQPGLKLALWPRLSVASDLGIPVDPISATECLISHNVATQEEVDTVTNCARGAGAKVLKEPGKTFWGGYAGYFQDHDRHIWEVVWNPKWNLND